MDRFDSGDILYPLTGWKIMARNTFVMYKDWGDMINELGTEDKASLLDGIYKYQTTKEIIEMTFGAKIIFAQIKKMFDKDMESYEEVCKIRSEAGKQGGLAKASKGKQKLANASKRWQTLPDNDNDNDIYIKKEIYKEKVREIIKQYTELGYDEEQLKIEAADCWRHWDGKMKKITAFSNWIKKGINIGTLKKKQTITYLNQ